MKARVLKKQSKKPAKQIDLVELNDIIKRVTTEHEKTEQALNEIVKFCIKSEKEKNE